MVHGFTESPLKLPGLLIIDTPGGSSTVPFGDDCDSQPDQNGIMAVTVTPLESLLICKYICRPTLCPEAKNIERPQLSLGDI